MHLHSSEVNMIPESVRIQMRRGTGPVERYFPTIRMNDMKAHNWKSGDDGSHKRKFRPLDVLHNSRTLRDGKRSLPTKFSGKYLILCWAIPNFRCRWRWRIWCVAKSWIFKTSMQRRFCRYVWAAYKARTCSWIRSLKEERYWSFTLSHVQDFLLER